MENSYLSIDCTKIRNNSEQNKTSQNEVMQPTTSNNYSRPIVPKPCPQPGRFWQAYYHSYLGHTWGTPRHTVIGGS